MLHTIKSTDATEAANSALVAAATVSAAGSLAIRLPLMSFEAAALTAGPAKTLKAAESGKSTRCAALLCELKKNGTEAKMPEPNRTLNPTEVG